MKSEKFIVLICTLYSVLCTPLLAQTSVLSIGVRGGGQTYLPTAAVGATGEVKPSIGGTGSLDLRYTFYGNPSDRFGIGFAIGAGVGYGSAGFKGTNTDRYSNIDYLGNQMDYTIRSTYSLKDRFAKADVSLLLALSIGNITLNVGPRLMLPFAPSSTISIDEASIDAYYPKYDVHVKDKMITGLLETPYQQNITSSLPKYNVLLAFEFGYEWYLTRTSSIGVQLFADIAVWSPKQSPMTNQQSPMISVAPISNANDPVPTVTVNSPDMFVSGKRYIDFGIRAYYAFTFENNIYHRYRRPRIRDNRFHYNRYKWW